MWTAFSSAARSASTPTELPTGGAQGNLHIGINYNRDNAAKFVGAFDGLLDELVIWNEVTTATFMPPTICRAICLPILPAIAALECGGLDAISQLAASRTWRD